MCLGQQELQQRGHDANEQHCLVECRLASLVDVPSLVRGDAPDAFAELPVRPREELGVLVEDIAQRQLLITTKLPR